MAAVVSLSGKSNSGLTRDRDKLQQAIESLQPQTMYKLDSAECPKIDYYQADLIENKHDSEASADAVRQVLNCSPGLDVKYDYNTAQLTEKEIPRPVKEKIWKSPVVQGVLKGPWLYDGNNIAWSVMSIGNLYFY